MTEIGQVHDASLPPLLPERARFEHWQPVLRSDRLRRRPVSVAVEGGEVVLFRAADGTVGAMPDRCPHRGMRLSKGRVRDGRLVCPYHGWCFTPDGETSSPGNLRLKARTPSLATLERYGLVWIKDRQSPQEAPDYEEEGLYLLHSAVFPVEAPVEVLLDNFTEVEHTAWAHFQFGYDPAEIEQVTNETEVYNDRVHVTTTGRQKPMFWISRAVLGLAAGDNLTCSWDTSFAPLRSIWRWWWSDPATGAIRPSRFKAIAHFDRLGPRRSRLVTIYLWDRDPRCLLGLPNLMLPLVRAGIDYEVKIDRRLVENVLDPGQDLAGAHLGRFDRALVMQRRRLAAQHGDASAPE